MGVYNSYVLVECDRCYRMEEIQPWEAATGHLATFCVDENDLPESWIVDEREIICNDCQEDES